MPLTIRELNQGNCRTYLLQSGDEAVLVDPVRERVDCYRRELEEHGLRLAFVVETHTHADHLMVNRQLKASLGAPLVMHRESPVPIVDEHVSDGERLHVGDTDIEVFHTPGHTPDSICLRVPGAVLTGDTLLIGSSGRTDFPGGDAGAQYDAVVGRLFRLPEDTVVWPGHDYKGQVSSTIGAQQGTNPRFFGKTREAYIDLMAQLGLPFPDRIQEALQVNQSGFEACEVHFPRVAELAEVPRIAPVDVARHLRGRTPPLVLDVREPEEFVGELGHIEGAILVPMDALEHRLPKLVGYADHEVILVCRAGARSATAAAILQHAGFKHVVNLEGGMLAWARASLPVQR